MYLPFENYVIAQRYQPLSASGIIIENSGEVRYVIIKANDHTKALEGKVVEVESKHAVRPLSDGKHFSIDYKHIIAIYE